MKKNDKTNVMRVLDSKKISYEFYTYEADPSLSGEEIATILGEDTSRVFKTLVTEGKSKQNYVFVIPVNKELDLKKAAKAAGEKSINMIKQKDLLGLTGYVHGGCSPIGMKKNFPTFIHESASGFDKIFVSAGKVGYQIQIGINDLSNICKIKMADLTTD
ncbi:Cys-tRNA(Pro) deacylase [Eubacterium xylanophilum]|uniref:Cys-tRNA(Pro) deacylase n=1 Tax=Eubacterium xylanophilum TaxID=39497 RepID=UPI00047D4C7F|nr:Cys-tRNA(Pro) deacylase [Eubacterium xylanophilum]